MTIQEINKMCDTNFDSVKKFKNEANWHQISQHQKLSESFIRKFKNKVKWYPISICQKLSEDFIRKFQDKVCWYPISEQQNLSPDFIREFQDRVDWRRISVYQKLSPDFIREFQDRVDWRRISKYQNLSEEFIREFQDRVNWGLISTHQKLSPEFIREFQDKLNLESLEDSWHYKSTEFKKQAVLNTGRYECYDDYFIAHKGIRSDRYSNYNFQYQYLAGETYESWCDCSGNENSYGLSVWDYKNAEDYCSELVIKVKVRYEDVGRVVHKGGKVRCFKIEILD